MRVGAGVCPHPTPPQRDPGMQEHRCAELHLSGSFNPGEELQRGWIPLKKPCTTHPPTSSASAPRWEIHEKIIILVSGGQGAEAGLGTAPGARRVGWAQDTLLPWDWGGPAHIFSWSGFSLGQGGAGKVRGRRSRGHFSRFPTGAPDPNTHTCGILPPPGSRKG